jgi:hypothetical protein
MYAFEPFSFLLAPLLNGLAVCPLDLYAFQLMQFPQGIDYGIEF